MKNVIGFVKGKNQEEIETQKQMIKEYCLKRNYNIEEFYEDDIEALFNDMRGVRIILCDLFILSNDIKKIYDYITYGEDYCCSCFETIKNGENYDFEIKLLEGVNNYD